MATQNDWLTTQLQHAEPHIADGGFTDQLMQQIAGQPHVIRPKQQRAKWLAVAVTLLGSSVAAFGLSHANVPDLQLLFVPSWRTGFTPAELMAMLATGWCCALFMGGLALVKLR